MTFADIRSELERITGNKTVTVPTLKVGENEYVTDSFKIAEWVSTACFLWGSQPLLPLLLHLPSLSASPTNPPHSANPCQHGADRPSCALENHHQRRFSSVG